jgi:hypothetical protein
LIGLNSSATGLNRFCRNPANPCPLPDPAKKIKKIKKNLSTEAKVN